MSGLGSRTFGRYHNRLLGFRLKKGQEISWGDANSYTDATPLNREECRAKAKAERRALTKG